MKRFYSLFLALALVLALLPAAAVPADAAIGGACGASLTWSYDSGSGRLTISGTGTMQNYTLNNPAPWAESGVNLKQVTISGGVTSIGNYAFYGLERLQTASIANSVTAIGTSAFASTGLTSLTLPAGLTKIEKLAFDGCSGLTAVTIPAGVSAIGEKAFFGCTGMTAFSVDAANTAYQSVGGVLYTKAGDRLVQYPCAKSGSFSVPGTVRVIAAGAFGHCRALSAVTIPSGVTTIGEDAFRSCTGLTALNLPGTLQQIGARAFQSCTGLTSVTIPASVTQIGAAPFASCSRLTAISVAPGSTAYIGSDGALLTKAGDLLLQYPTGKSGSFTVPAGVKTIGEDAFRSCRGLRSLTLPAGLTEIRSGAFYYCTGLSAVTLPSTLTKIGDSAFAYSGLTAIQLPNSVTAIGKAAFSRCSLLNSAVLSTGLREIPAQAFDWCRTLGAITVPAGVTAIGANAFASCTALGSLSLPATLTRIGAHAFEETAITAVSIPGSVTAIEDGAFLGCSRLTGVSIPAGVKTLGESAFCDCAALETLSLQNGLSLIGDYAFCGCEKLKAVSIPGTVQVVGKDAFSGCEALSALAIAEGVRRIYDRAFWNCQSLTAAVLPSTVRSVGGQIFGSCPKLNAITVAGKDTVISSQAFGWYYAKPGDVELTGNSSLVIYGFAGSTAQKLTETDTFLTFRTLPKPSIQTQPAAVQTAAGKTVSFTVKASGYAMTYQWQKSMDSGVTWSDCTYAGATTANFSFTATELLNGWFYRCLVTNPTGTTTSAAARLGVSSTARTQPIITQQPSSITAKAGTIATLQLSAVGGGLSYQWQKSKDGGVTWSNCSSTGCNRATFSFTAAEGLNGWKYRCVIKNSMGSVTSKTVQLTVTSTATSQPTISRQPSAQTAELGSTVTFSVKAVGGDLHYQWQKSTNGGSTWSNCSWTGNNLAEFSFRVSPGLNGLLYRCIVSNSKGSVTSSAAKLTVA